MQGTPTSRIARDTRTTTRVRTGSVPRMPRHRHVGSETRGT